MVSVVSMFFTLPSYAMTGGNAASVTISHGAGSAPNCAQTKNCFDPSTLKVAAGTTVTWTNHDTVSHTVTSGNPSDNQTGTLFNSNLIPSGKSFSFTFKEPGTYNYFCEVHPWMNGKVIVTSSTTGTSQPSPAPQPSSTPREATPQSTATPQPATPTPQTSTTTSQSGTPTQQASAPPTPLTPLPTFTTPPTSSSTLVTITTGSAALTSCEQTSSCFSPDVLYVSPGTSVTWKNTDLVSHDVIYGSPESGSPSLFDSNSLSPGQSFTYHFVHPGIYPYYDKAYPWELGFVYVK